MDTCQYKLSEEIPYGLEIVSSPNYDHNYCFEVGNTMISGKLVKHSWCGRLFTEERMYKNGKLHGTQVGWYNDGSQWFESEYKNGNLNGLTLKWYDGDDGSIKTRRYYKDGKRDGISQGWYRNGNKKYAEYYENGALDGTAYGWYENGNKKHEMNYSAGKLDGISSFWRENGWKERDEYYENDSLLSRDYDDAEYYCG